MFPFSTVESSPTVRNGSRVPLLCSNYTSNRNMFVSDVLEFGSSLHMKFCRGSDGLQKSLPGEDMSCAPFTTQFHSN